MSHNDWTNNELEIAWLKHFDEHTKLRTVKVYRLLIIDEHENHNFLEFQEYCQEHKIITLCMLFHSSHLLQSLDVSCFSSLKRAYKAQIIDLIRNRINHVNKLEFLSAFKIAFEKTFISRNIFFSFRAAELISFDSKIVIFKLDVRLRTLTSLFDIVFWEFKTSTNVQEMKSQSMLIRERFQRHQNSSSTKMLNELTKLIKDVSIMMHRTILISNQIASLQKTNIEASQRKSRKRKYIKNRLMLTMTEDANFVSLTDADVTNSSDEINDEVTTKKRSSKQKRCEKCENLEHNSRICQKDKETVSKSDTSSQQLMKWFMIELLKCKIYFSIKVFGMLEFPGCL